MDDTLLLLLSSAGVTMALLALVLQNQLKRDK